MTKAERKVIIDWASKLSNDELEREYYDAVFATLGSEAEEMYERGWDKARKRFASGSGYSRTAL